MKKNCNTHLGVDLKTLLRKDRLAKVGKNYLGVLRRDVECDEFRYDEHFTFIETLHAPIKRNPRVFSGRYITITRRRDGTLHPNFRPMKMGPDFSAERYATAVGNELMWALEGLIEK
jgi:hypothetical protein